MELLEGIRWSAVLSLRGRYGRRAFWLLSGPPLLVIFLVMWFILLYSPRPSNDASAFAAEAWDTVFFTGFGFALVVGFFGVRRLHDLDRPGWWMLFLVLPFPLAYIPILDLLLLLVPFVGIALGMMVGFVPGKPVRNRYGLPGSGSPFENERLQGRTAAGAVRR